MAQFPGMGSSAPKIYDGKISGVIIDSTSGKPVEFANVALFDKGSSKPIDGTVSDEKGSFKLKNIRSGKYRVNISFIGYDSFDFDSVSISDNKPNVDLGRIIIAPSSILLGEATVEAEKQLIEFKIDKLVYNAEKDITSKGGNATDVLRKVPMVQVDLEGNVMLQGTMNVKVLINNKPSSITAGSVADAMKMIPADEIDKVEVITSPGARYDAEGTGGIINIITKKNNLQGWSGMINAGLGTRSSNLFGNAGYRSGRFGTGLNFGGFAYSGNGELSTTRTTPTSVLLQDGDNKNTGFGPYLQWTADYDISSKSSLSSSFRLQNFNNGSKGVTDNSYSLNGGPFYKIYSNDFENRTSSLNYDASVDYKRTFKKKEQELVLSAQYTNSDKDVNYDIVELDSLGTEFYKENSLNNSVNEEVTFQADYVHPVKKWMTIEAGGKSILRNVNSDYDYEIYDFPSDAFIDDPVRSNVFDYNQDILAAYAQANITYKNFGFRAGARYEHTTVKGDFNQQLESFEKDYDNLLPSLAVSYSKPTKYMLKLSYTQRLQRPGMNYLNPYVNESDPMNISYGNPDLDAELSNALELGWNWFRKFGSINTTVYHRFTDNAIESVRFIDSNDVYVTTYGNVGENFSTGASIAVNVMWQMKIFLGSNFNIYYYKVNGTGAAEGLTNDGVNYNVSLFGSYKFSKAWGIQAFGNFNGPKYSVQGMTTSFFYYNLSGRREFKNGKGGIALGLDNFATWYLNLRNEYEGEGFKYVNNNKIFFLGARISFDYRFGKMEFGNQKKKKRIKNDDLKDDGGDGGLMNGGGR